MTPKEDGRRRNNLSPEQRREISRLGGLALIAKRGSRYMARIGSTGGRAVSENTDHMRSIGSKGGKSPGRPKSQPENQ